MIVVSDTTPLNYLILIGSDQVLPPLYGSVLIPTQVVHELQDPRAPQPVRDWANNLPPWILVKEGDPARFPLLDRGEAAALALAIETKASTLLADDMEARLAAQTLGIAAVGTVGVLAAAHRASLLDFDSAVKDLRATSFHVHEEVIAAIRISLRPTEPGERGS